MSSVIWLCKKSIIKLSTEVDTNPSCLWNCCSCMFFFLHSKGFHIQIGLDFLAFKACLYVGIAKCMVSAKCKHFNAVVICFVRNFIEDESYLFTDYFITIIRFRFVNITLQSIFLTKHKKYFKIYLSNI